MVLEDSSPEQMALALDASKIAAGVLLSTLPQASLHDEPGILWFETGLALDAYNGVLRTNLPPEELPDTARRILAHFRERRLPFHWHVGPFSQPNFADLLEAEGICLDEVEPGMGLDLRATIAEDVPVTSSLVIEEVLAQSQLRLWAETTFCGAPPGAVQCVFTAHAGLRRDAASPIHLYLGILGGEPVATVKLYFAAGVAYVGRVVTVPACRRQGIGTAMTVHALRIAKEAGYRIAVLTASAMGISIYRRLGFQECCVVSTYAWDPPQ
jgi:ribosomal protein S18 acetylase RimI-like enzyme